MTSEPSRADHKRKARLTSAWNLRRAALNLRPRFVRCSTARVKRSTPNGLADTASTHEIELHLCTAATQSRPLVAPSHEADELIGARLILGGCSNDGELHGARYQQALSRTE